MTLDGKAARSGFHLRLDHLQHVLGWARPRKSQLSPCLSAPRQALNRGTPVPERERRSRAGIFCRWHRRGNHHGVIAFPAVIRDCAQFELHVQGRAVNIKQVGRELGVRYVLEGSVRKAATQLRITAQLIDAASETHLWADHFDGGLGEIFDLQDQVTASVVGRAKAGAGRD
jgi:hypothetical protein